MRKQLLAVAAGCAAMIAGTTIAAAATQQTSTAPQPRSAGQAGLPVSKIEKIIGADGQVSSGILTIDIDRGDLHASGPDGVHFKEGFQLQHEITFESLGHGRAIMNGDLALKPSETQRVIDGFIANHVVFQAFHQHLYDMSPMVWYMHFRGVGTPTKLASEIRNVINRTATQLPQQSPKHPTTSLPVQRLAKILGGEATVGQNGVVTVDVPRKHGVVLGGYRVSPDLNIATNIQFQPDGGASSNRATVIPDFAMTAGEIERVTARMRGYGWDDGCLYNQETAESPQLYFSHFYKTGDPISLAKQIRHGLDLTAATG